MGSRSWFWFLAVPVLICSGCATVARPVSPVAVCPGGGTYHIVGGGQTLWRIARTYNVDVKELMRVNGISDPGQLGVGQKLFIPRAPESLPLAPVGAFVTADVENIVGGKHYGSHWRTITVHHSATLEGNAEAFDRNHRRRGMGGLFYHFVIGNGNGAGDGEIEVGWRWKKQVPANRPDDIQICLVGDFDRQTISDKQFESLLKLVSVLRKQYNIPLGSIRKHKSIKGKHTACPGSGFPFERLIVQLRKLEA